jgi:diguanylate cyclase (GGDEF)-like protein
MRSILDKAAGGAMPGWVCLALLALALAAPGLVAARERPTEDAAARIAAEVVPDLETRVAAVAAAVDAGAYDDARARAQELLRIGEAQGRKRYIAHALGYLGVIDRRFGLLEEAAARHKRSLELRIEIEDTSGQANSWGNLGNVYRDLGRWPEALDAQLKSLALRQARPREDRIDVAYRSIAILYRELGETTLAREYFERAERAAVDAAVPGALSTVRGTFAGLLNDLGEHELARQKAEAALAEDLAYGRNYGTALEHVELGRALIGLGRIEDARVALAEALAWGEQMKQVEIIGRSLLHLGEVDARSGRLPEAAAALQRSVAVLADSNLYGHLGEALLQLQQVQERRGDVGAALAVANRRIALHGELFNAQASRRTARLEHEHREERSRQQIETLQQRTRIAELELDRGRYLAWIAALLVVFLCTVVALALWRNRALAGLNRLLGERAQEVAAANETLQRKSRELYEASIRDPLTGLFNRRHAIERLEAGIAEATAARRDLSILLIDFDHFKRINDTLGHQAGDEVLRRGAQTIADVLGAEGLLARYGGEELIALLPDAGREAAVQSAERLRRLVEQRMADAPRPVTVSIGVAALRDVGRGDLEELVRRADAALYTAKAAGRNRVVAAPAGDGDGDALTARP